MRKIFFILFLLFLATWAASDATTTSSEDAGASNFKQRIFSLKECYQLALKKSETIAIQGALIDQASAHFSQSLSQILPSISYVYSNRYQDGSGSSNFTLKEIPESKFTFSQPLFSGFKEFAAMAASKAEKRQKILEKRRAEDLLFVDVSDAFYFYLNYQEQEKIYKTIEGILEQRVEELGHREELGRSRKSEVVSAQAQLSRIQADMETILANKEEAGQLLEFYLGTSFDGIQEEIREMKVDSEEEYLNKITERPDVKASFESWQKSRKQVAVAKSGFWPKVSADGNYYQKRVGNSSGVDWDATLTVNVPLFKGGENISAVKESKSVETQAQLVYEQTKRKAILDVQNIYSKFQHAVKKENALKKAVDAAQENYQLQQSDYNQNLVSNLDVLQALQDLRQSQRDYLDATIFTKQTFWQLLVAVGKIENAI